MPLPTFNLRLSLRIFAFCVTAGLLYYLFTTYDFSGLFSSVNRQWLILGPLVVLIQLLHRLISSIQISRFLTAYKLNVPSLRVLRAQLIAWFYTLFLPGYLAGGGITWYLLTRENKKHAETVNALAIVQIVNLLVLFVVSLIAAVQDTVIRQSGYALYLGLAACVLGISLLPFVVPAINAVSIGKIGKMIPRLSRFAETTKIYLYLGWKRICEQIVLALAGIVLSALTAKILMDMSGVQAPLSACFWLGGLATVIHMLPITLAGTGLREVTLVTLLGAVYQVPSSNALLFSLLTFAVMLVIGVLGAIAQFTSNKPSSNP